MQPRWSQRLVSHYLYLLARDDPDQPHVKIGVTSDLGKRLSDLQTGSSATLFVLFAYMLGDRHVAVRAERSLHGRLRSIRLKGEWYALPWHSLLRISAAHVATLLRRQVVPQGDILDHAGIYEALALADEIEPPSRFAPPLFIVKALQAEDIGSFE